MKFHYFSLENCSSAEGIVIVIDVLRAFSTAAYAFNSGVQSIRLVSTVDEALALKRNNPNWLAMGEVNGLPPKGFDLGNSPTEIQSKMIRGRHLIQRTGAGTQGVVRSVQAGMLLAASFVVASATVKFVENLAPAELSFVITGGEKNEEDLACAQYLQALFERKTVKQEEFIKRVYGSADAVRHLDPEIPEFPVFDLDYCTRIEIFKFPMPVTRDDDRFIMLPNNVRFTQVADYNAL